MTEDDGLVLYEGTLYPPEILSRACARKFRKERSGLPANLARRAAIGRYRDNYRGSDDKTTPSFAEFLALSREGA